MNPLDLQFLEACFEARKRQLEMLPFIAGALRIPEDQVFYHWAIYGRDNGIDSVQNSPWKFTFHGFECDLKNTEDGRFLRYDFGPGGRADCVTTYGILQFVMTSKAPWKEFLLLQNHLAQRGPPYDYLSGDHQKASAIWDRLEQEVCFEPANPELVEFRDRYTTIRSDGREYLEFPEGTSNERIYDCLVAEIRVLRVHGEVLLRSAGKSLLLLDP